MIHSIVEIVIGLGALFYVIYGIVYLFQHRQEPFARRIFIFCINTIRVISFFAILLGVYNYFAGDKWQSLIIVTLSFLFLTFVHPAKKDDVENRYFGRITLKRFLLGLVSPFLQVL